MGSTLSTSTKPTPEPPSPTPTPNLSLPLNAAATTPPSPDSPKLDPKSKNPDPKTPAQYLTDPTQNPEGVGRNIEGSEGQEEEEEEEGGEGDGEDECGFCLFMKAGGCRESFIAWEKCVEDAEMKEEDIVEKCHEVTAKLHKCMEAHSDYYGPILNVEKEVEEKAAKKLELEKERVNGEANVSALQDDQGDSTDQKAG